MNKCSGCGAVINSCGSLCERCFRIRNYSDYKLVDVDNSHFVDILKGINLTNDLVVLVVDVFNFSNLSQIRSYLDNDILVVLTKKDLLPKRISDEKLISYFSNLGLNYKDIVVVSSKKNYNFDLLHQLINRYKKSKNVYVVGFTNAGKSTMINKFIYDYSDNDFVITTSFLPSTTLDTISVNVNDDLVLIDTPGILGGNSLYHLVDGKELKRIIPRCEIRPISYQVKGTQVIMIDRYLSFEVSDINLVIFMSNSLDIKRLHKAIDKSNIELSVCNNDIVIDGLGFIKFIGSGRVRISCDFDINIYTRDSLI